MKIIDLNYLHRNYDANRKREAVVVRWLKQYSSSNVSQAFAILQSRLNPSLAAAATH